MKIFVIIIVPLLLVAYMFGGLILYRYSTNIKLKKKLYPFTTFCENCGYPIKDKIFGIRDFFFENDSNNCPNCGSAIKNNDGNKKT